MDNKTLRIKDVLEKLGISRSTLYRLMDNDGFPKPIKLSDRLNVWRESAIDEWLKEKEAAQ